MDFVPPHRACVQPTCYVQNYYEGCQQGRYDPFKVLKAFSFQFHHGEVLVSRLRVIR